MSMEDYNFNKARQAWGIRPGPIPGSIIYKQENEMYGPQTAVMDAKQDPPIISELHQLQQNLDSLQDHIIQLESRLLPVFRHEPPEVEKEYVTKEMGGSSPVVNSLREFNAHVYKMRNQMSLMRDRLEV
jgi:hypothetical protein